jgi:protein-disulfide isomerase
MAEKLDITGTPAFVMGDSVVRGYAPLDDMRNYVKDARTGG